MLPLRISHVQCETPPFKKCFASSNSVFPSTKYKFEVFTISFNVAFLAYNLYLQK